jgi:hypothetical protein
LPAVRACMMYQQHHPLPSKPEQPTLHRHLGRLDSASSTPPLPSA